MLTVVAQVTALLGFEPTVRFSGPVETMIPASRIGDVEAVVREAMTNAARHAHATELSVDICADEGTLTIVVTDNGVGIGESQPAKRTEQHAATSRGAGRRVGHRLHTGQRNTIDMDDSANPLTPIRVFLLDDHEIVRRGLIDLLEATDDITVVGEAGTAADALHRIPAAQPDVAVLDARLPDGSGIDVCRDIRSRNPEVNCLILTSYDDDDALFAAVMAGAAGYLLKQIAGRSLTEAIREVAAGRSLMDPAVTGRLLDRLRQPSLPDPRLEALTNREREILDLIAEGLSNREIGLRLFLAEKTVKNYVSTLLSKLDMRRRTQAAVFGAEVHRKGL